MNGSAEFKPIDGKPAAGDTVEGPVEGGIRAAIVRKIDERPKSEGGVKTSWTRLWLGRTLAFMMAVSAFVLLIEGRNTAAITTADGENLVRPMWDAVFDFWTVATIGLLGAIGLPASFQYVGPALVAAAGKVRGAVGGFGGAPSGPPFPGAGGRPHFGGGDDPIRDDESDEVAEYIADPESFFEGGDR